jgi:hypothetical protein
MQMKGERTLGSKINRGHLTIINTNETEGKKEMNYL